MSYHYKNSGLDNVYLVNGYHIHQTEYGEGISIEQVDKLHKAIGQWLIALPKPLTGQELRFLRVEMDLSQKHLADIIGAKEQTLRLWEKNRSKPVPGPADRLVRVLYAEFIGDNGDVRRMVERLAELDQVEAADACFQEADGRWRPTVAA